jgi:hypothetical protein
LDDVPVAGIVVTCFVRWLMGEHSLFTELIDTGHGGYQVTVF